MTKSKKALEQEKAAVREWMASGHIYSVAWEDGATAWIGPGGIIFPPMTPAGPEVDPPWYAVFSEYEPGTEDHLRGKHLSFADAMRLISEPL